MWILGLFGLEIITMPLQYNLILSFLFWIKTLNSPQFKKEVQLTFLLGDKNHNRSWLVVPFKEECSFGGGQDGCLWKVLISLSQ